MDKSTKIKLLKEMVELNKEMYEEGGLQSGMYLLFKQFEGKIIVDNFFMDEYVEKEVEPFEYYDKNELDELIGLYLEDQKSEERWIEN